MTLLIEKGYKLNRNQLQGIETPVGTATHKPVGHFEAASLTAEFAKSNGYHIVSEDYGLNPSGSQMFGVLRVMPEQYAFAQDEFLGDQEMIRTIGLRNSHDKRFAFGLAAGVSVMVCSNLCFGAEAVINRKHTSGIDLEVFIPEIFDALDGQFDNLYTNIDRLKDTRVFRKALAGKVVKAAQAGAIPSADILPVIDMFENPIHEDFSDRSEWSLYNCFNEIAKKYSAARADKCYRVLGEQFKLN
jgi:hypothetical protein